MNKIACLIVDDEPLALSLTESYVRKTPYLDCVGKCSNAIEAMHLLNSLKIDLLFLDIQMPELNGIQFSKTLSRDIKIIFTTAFNEYAVEGFKVDAVDYLLKPFDYGEFLRAANKAREWISLLNAKQQPLVRTEQQEEEQFIFVKSEYKQVKIILSDILFIEGLKDYVKIWLDGNPKPVMTIISLKALEGELPADKFMRVHRSYIIALHKVESVERSQAVIGNMRITVADQYREKFLDFIEAKSLN